MRGVMHSGYIEASPGKAETELALKAFAFHNLRKIVYCHIDSLMYAWMSAAYLSLTTSSRRSIVAYS
jgi:hypothetical protein